MGGKAMPLGRKERMKYILYIQSIIARNRPEDNTGPEAFFYSKVRARIIT